MFLLNALAAVRMRAIRGNASPPRRLTRSPRVCRPGIEMLEDRFLPSIYSFTLLADDGPHSFFSAGSLGTPTMNDQGTVTFHAALRSGGEGVFTRDTAAGLGIIAITSSRLHGFPLPGSIHNTRAVNSMGYRP